MQMNKVTYERLQMDVTEFDVEDIITTSYVQPPFRPEDNEAPVGFAPNGI